MKHKLNLRKSNTRYLIFIFCMFSTLVTNSVLAQCSIPKIFIDTGEPKLELVQRFETYEKDSLRFETNEECRLKFYSEFVYCLRRTENSERALFLVDSVLMNVEMDDYELQKTSLEVEKILLLSLSKKDSSFYKSLDELESSFIKHQFFETDPDREETLDLISVTVGLFTEVGRFGFVNSLLLKQLELNTSQDSFYLFHNWFMIGLNNLNNYSYHKANEDFQTAYTYTDCEGVDSSMLAELSVLQGTALIELDSFHKAIRYFKNALSLVDNSIEVEIYAYIGLAKAYDGLGMSDSLFLIQEDLKSIRNNEEVPDFLKRDAVYYMAIDNLHKRNLKDLKYNNHILEGILDTNILHDRYLFYQMKQHVTTLEKFDDDEITSYLNARSIDVERKSINELQTMNSLKLKYETEKKEQENKLLKEQEKIQDITIERRGYQLLATGLGILFLVGALYLLWRRSKKRKKINEVLQDKNHLLSEQKAQIELLNQELNHRVRNNLQLVSSLMGMQAYRLEDQEAKDAFLESQNRLQAMNYVYNKLSSDTASDNRIINLSEYLLELCKHLERTLSTEFQHLNIEIDSSNGQVNCEADKSIRIGLIVNELITNSVKYAFGNQDKPTINVYLESIGDEKLQLIIKDNGSGMIVKQETEREDSLGTKLISLLVGQMKGQMEKRNKEGLEYTFVL